MTAAAVERRRKPARRPAPGRLDAAAKSAGAPAPVLPEPPNIEARIDGERQITLGTIHPVRCVAIANDGHNSLAMLVRRKDETLAQLRQRLDATIAKAYDEEVFTD